MNKRIALKVIITLLVIFGVSCVSLCSVAYSESIKENSLKSELLKNPTDAKAYLELGKYYQRKKNNDEAIKYLSKAIELNPELSDGYFYLSASYAQNSDINQAIKNMEKVNELTPNSPHILENLAQFYVVSKQNDKAVMAYKEAIALDSPQKTEIMIKLAELYEKLGLYDDAISAYKEMAKGKSGQADAAEKIRYLNIKKETKDALSTVNENDVTYVVKNSEPKTSGEMVYEIENPKRKVACLIYRSYSPMLAPYGPDNIADFAKSKKSEYVNTTLTIKYHDFEKEHKNVYERYGYSVGYNVLSQLLINKQDGIMEMRELVLYPKEVDDDIRNIVLKSLMENGCSIVDLTPVKKNFDSRKLSDIIKDYRKSDNIDGLFVFCYQLISRTGYQNPAYGLNCYYKFMLIDADNENLLFDGSSIAEANIPKLSNKGFLGKFNLLEAPIHWIDIKSEKVRSGVFDEKWLEKKMLYQLGFDKPQANAFSPYTSFPKKLRRLFENLNKTE